MGQMADAQMANGAAPSFLGSFRGDVQWGGPSDVVRGPTRTYSTRAAVAAAFQQVFPLLPCTCYAMSCAAMRFWPSVVRRVRVCVCVCSVRV